MGADSPSKGPLASLMMIFPCFPTAREKPKASVGNASDFQCISCARGKRKTTVICGAGVTGLSSAYWLGQMKKTADHDIIVLEARSQCFQGASGFNSGLLSRHWFCGDLRVLADHSFGIYQDLARKQPTFQDTCDYHENALFQAHCRDGPPDPRAPSWMKMADGWHLQSEPAIPRVQDRTHEDASSATINPSGLGSWLYDRCLELGVHIETDCTLFKVCMCDCGKLRSVLVKSVQGIHEHACDDLVFAAGTRTPRLVRELFPGFTRDFHETTNSGNWIVVKIPTDRKDQMRAEVILDDVVNHQLEFVGREDKATHDFVIWVCGLNNEETEPGQIKEHAEPDEDAIDRLRDYAAKFLWNKSAQQIGPELLKKGRTYRPTIDRELPIVTPLSGDDLYGARNSKDQSRHIRQNCSKTGVWVCTGHGKYGITLGLGSGKLMSQMILGKKPDLSISALGFPP